MKRDDRGRFVKGEHWRPYQIFRDKNWLTSEYVDKKRSAAEIAADFGISAAAILFWLRKHNIPRRDVSEARSVKHWGSSGEKNGMYGKFREASGNWRGGCSPERQTFYSSSEWARASIFVWRRDKATCQRHNVKNHSSALHIHHIIPFEIKEFRSDVNNLVLLCAKCHRFVHSKYNTEHEFLKQGGDAEC